MSSRDLSYSALLIVDASHCSLALSGNTDPLYQKKINHLVELAHAAKKPVYAVCRSDAVEEGDFLFNPDGVMISVRSDYKSGLDSEVIRYLDAEQDGSGPILMVGVGLLGACFSLNDAELNFDVCEDLSVEYKNQQLITSPWKLNDFEQDKHTDDSIYRRYFKLNVEPVTYESFLCWGDFRITDRTAGGIDELVLAEAVTA